VSEHASTPSSTVNEDLTAKARIRDAAMQLFGEVGYERATTRAIAERAGVTSGLIRHHYGSKERLLAACDEWIIELIRRPEAQAEAGAGMLSPIESTGPYRQYLTRALFEGRAAAVFDHMVASAQAWLTVADRTRPDPPEVPVRARAAVQTAFALSIGMLAGHVSRGMQTDITTPEGEQLLLQALLDLYSHPLLTPQQAQHYRTELAADPRRGGNRDAAPRNG
jgi:AcrR family transcriptional regulator